MIFLRHGIPKNRPYVIGMKQGGVYLGHPSYLGVTAEGTFKKMRLNVVHRTNLSGYHNKTLSELFYLIHYIAFKV